MPEVSQTEVRLNNQAANVSHLVALLRDEVVGVAWLAHELKGAKVEAGQDGVSPAARRDVAGAPLGLAAAHRGDVADCASMAGQISGRSAC